jgi:hypothetical protein
MFTILPGSNWKQPTMSIRSILLIIHCEEEPLEKKRKPNEEDQLQHTTTYSFFINEDSEQQEENKPQCISDELAESCKRLVSTILNLHPNSSFDEQIDLVDSLGDLELMKDICTSLAVSRQGTKRQLAARIVSAWKSIEVQHQYVNEKPLKERQVQMKDQIEWRLLLLQVRNHYYVTSGKRKERKEKTKQNKKIEIKLTV